MSAIEFSVAAKEAEPGEDEDVVEVPIEGKTYMARRLTVGQSALLVEALNGANRVQATFNLIEGFIGVEGRKHVESLIWARRLDFADLIGGGTERNPEGGLVDKIIQAFTPRPTQPSTDSSQSPVKGGRKSKGRSPGKGSIHSNSGSTSS